ncbi:MAG: hypothetical protein K2X39_07385 [Silvanigrellaceae bacterium]|nr:hypothetical protein [Silvanigrellaceae bacterium]
MLRIDQIIEKEIFTVADIDFFPVRAYEKRFYQQNVNYYKAIWQATRLPSTLNILQSFQRLRDTSSQQLSSYTSTFTNVTLTITNLSEIQSRARIYEDDGPYSLEMRDFSTPYHFIDGVGDANEVTVLKDGFAFNLNNSAVKGTNYKVYIYQDESNDYSNDVFVRVYK